MSERSQPSFAVRRGGKHLGIFLAKDLKGMAIDGRLQETDEVSRPGDVWHRASTVRGLEFKAPKVQIPKQAPIQQSTVATKPARDTAITPQVMLQNPVSVLLNTLVTDRLSTLYQSVNRGELKEAEFRVTGAMMLEQLQQAVTHLETADSGHPKPPPGKQAGALPAKVASPANVREQGSRQQKPGIEPSEFASFPTQSAAPTVQSPASGTGIGAVAKLAGAAALGGAFGYLLASQSRSYPGMNTGYGYGGGFQNNGDLGGFPVQSGSAVSDSSDESMHANVVGFDTTGDGISDTFVADSNADGVADFRATDDDGDGLIDSFETDNDRDGDFDQKFVSQHDDGDMVATNVPEGSADFEPDLMGMDDDIDGEFEAAELDDELESDDSLDSSDEVGDFDSGDFDSGDVDSGGDFDFGE
jgi:hypothetical protein